MPNLDLARNKKPLSPAQPGKTIFLMMLLASALGMTPVLADSVSGFDETLSLNGISFHISSANDSSLNQLKIVPSGLEIDNTTIEQEIDGTISGAEIADINNDGSAEIYIYINSAGSGSYGSVVAYSANNNKSISGIYLASLENDKVNSQGYMGHDEFSIIENRLTRRFPIYKRDDINSAPSGGARQLEYKLEMGEASWQLRLDKSSDL